MSPWTWFWLTLGFVFTVIWIVDGIVSRRRYPNRSVWDVLDLRIPLPDAPEGRDAMPDGEALK